MDKFTTITVEQRGAIEILSLNRPDALNAVTPEMADELIAYCKERLASLKCPRSVDFRTDLPRTDTGKLVKRLLKDVGATIVVPPDFIARVGAYGTILMVRG